MNRTRLRAIKGLRQCVEGATCRECVFEKDRDCSRHLYKETLRMLVIDDTVIEGTKALLRRWRDHPESPVMRIHADQLLIIIDKLEHGANYEQCTKWIEGKGDEKNAAN